MGKNYVALVEPKSLFLALLQRKVSCVSHPCLEAVYTLPLQH